MIRRITWLALILGLATAGTSSAQSSQQRPAPPRRQAPQPAARPPRVTVSLNAGAQLGGATVHQESVFALNADNAYILNDIARPSAPFFDIGASYKLTRRGLALGAAFSSLSRTSTSGLQAELPHPLYFTTRSVEVTVERLGGVERGLHLSLAHPLPMPRNSALEVMILGGPSWLHVAQDLVIDLNLVEEYPFDEVDIESAVVASPRPKASAWGFHVGTDVSWRLSRTFRVGGLIRFTRASATLDDSVGDEVEMTAGGMMAGGGLRVLF